MKKEQVVALFTLAKIEILDIYEILNEYWPNTQSYFKLMMENPWWLVQTKVGFIKIGPRKRVISIDWGKTPIRKIVTSDDVTKDETYVHAWTDQKALEYLVELGKEISRLTNL